MRDSDLKKNWRKLREAHLREASQEAINTLKQQIADAEAEGDMEAVEELQDMLARMEKGPTQKVVAPQPRTYKSPHKSDEHRQVQNLRNQLKGEQKRLERLHNDWKAYSKRMSTAATDTQRQKLNDKIDLLRHEYGKQEEIVNDIKNQIEQLQTSIKSKRLTELQKEYSGYDPIPQERMYSGYDPIAESVERSVERLGKSKKAWKQILYERRMLLLEHQFVDRFDKIVAEELPQVKTLEEFEEVLHEIINIDRAMEDAFGEDVKFSNTSLGSWVNFLEKSKKWFTKVSDKLQMAFEAVVRRNGTGEERFGPAKRRIEERILKNIHDFGKAVVFFVDRSVLKFLLRKMLLNKTVGKKWGKVQFKEMRNFLQGTLSGLGSKGEEAPESGMVTQKELEGIDEKLIVYEIGRMVGSLLMPLEPEDTSKPKEKIDWSSAMGYDQSATQTVDVDPKDTQDIPIEQSKYDVHDGIDMLSNVMDIVERRQLGVDIRSALNNIPDIHVVNVLAGAIIEEATGKYLNLMQKLQNMPADTITEPDLMKQLEKMPAFALTEGLTKLIDLI
jgi:hypothetical protein